MARCACLRVDMGRTSHYRVKVEFGDCDPAGIVFFPNYFRWSDAAARAYMVACGLPAWRDLEKTTGIIGTPLVSTSADFKAPASYGDEIDVHTSIEQWKRSSFEMRHVLRRDDVILCELREIRVFAIRDPQDASRIKAVPPPLYIKALCEDGASKRHNAP